jgi:hypothetical protein
MLTNPVALTATVCLCATESPLSCWAVFAMSDQLMVIGTVCTDDARSQTFGSFIEGSTGCHSPAQSAF